VRFNADYYAAAYNLDPAHFIVTEPQPAQPAGGGMFSATTAGQRAIDASRDEVTDTMQAQARGMVQPIIDMVGRARDYNEAREMLLKLYPDMDSTKAEQALQRAMFISTIAGRAAANG
jgi:phage gp29-like protein